MWLHFACRLLTLAELQHALAVNKTHAGFDVGNIPPLKALLDCCFGLVIFDEETLTLRFMHYALGEYLRQHCTSIGSLEENMTKYALLSYAALYWGTHVEQQCSDGLAKLAKMVVEHECERLPCAVQALYIYIDVFRSPCSSIL